MYDGKDKEFGYETCWGIDRTIQTVIDDLGGIDQSLGTVEEETP